MCMLLFGFCFTLPALLLQFHLLPLPQSATPRSAACTVLSVLRCVLLRELVTVVCACSGYVNCVFVCRCSCWGWLLASDSACVCACYMWAVGVCVFLHSYLQCVCLCVCGGALVQGEACCRGSVWCSKLLNAVSLAEKKCWCPFTGHVVVHLYCRKTLLFLKRLQ